MGTGTLLLQVPCGTSRIAQQLLETQEGREPWLQPCNSILGKGLEELERDRGKGTTPRKPKGLWPLSSRCPLRALEGGTQAITGAGGWEKKSRWEGSMKRALLPAPITFVTAQGLWAHPIEE